MSKKTIQDVMADAEKKFGSGSFMRLSRLETGAVTYSGASTGLLSLDCILGGHGFPRGRVCEIFGPEGSGKTGVAFHAIAQVQKAGGVAVFFDAEHALDVTYCSNVGVDLEAMLFSQPDYAEMAWEQMEMLLEAVPVPSLYVIDSLAAMVPREEVESEFGSQQIALAARVHSKALRRLVPKISKLNCAVLIINQLRTKIGGFGFGPQEETPGGKAIRYYAGVRMDVRRMEAIKVGEEVVGQRVRLRVVKNKVAPPFRETKLDLYFGHGFSAETDLLDVGVAKGVLQQSGAWYSYAGHQLAQGREGVRELLIGDPALMADIREAILKKASDG